MKTQSLILTTATRFLLPLLLLFSFFLLLRGHNEPGGGFVGGLVAAAAFALYAIALDVQSAQRLLKVEPRTLIATGILAAAMSGVISLFTGNPFLMALWLKHPIPVLGKVGTPLIFDIGVYLLVLGITLKIIFALAED
jgi:multicomponent Na+:H+ antiporter subunit B